MSRLARLRCYVRGAGAALSLLLCIAVSVLWVRSFAVTDRFESSRIRRQADNSIRTAWFELTSGGRIWLRMQFAHVGRPGQGWAWDSYYERADKSGGQRRYWFRREPNHLAYPQSDDIFGGPAWDATRWGPLRSRTWTQREPQVPFIQRNINLGVSHWFLALLLAILPARALSRMIGRWRRERLRRRAGLCAACGYDLRATPARCPECGARCDREGAARILAG
jgi:4-amino-4-deoxy-L-arabinose transferase-like glycosyltransferase